MSAHKASASTGGTAAAVRDAAASHHSSHQEEEGRDEPQTPLWLTLLGVALFFAVGLLFLATRPDGKTAEELSQAAAPPAPAPSGSAPAAAPAAEH